MVVSDVFQAQVQTRFISKEISRAEPESVNPKGSLHESELSFNPERHIKLNSCLHGRLS